MGVQGKIDNTINGIFRVDENQPHLVIRTVTDIHVYPRSYFEKFAKGETVEVIPLDVMRAIVYEWLCQEED